MTESQQSKPRSSSMSQASESSQTAADFIKEQLILEAEAREALPYQFDACTRDLGPLKLNVYSCLTCNPPPPNDPDAYTPAGFCYACSISCHGGHELVELFKKRNFVCDCGTTRLPDTAPCNLRINHKTGQKGGVIGEEPAQGNTYNQNFRNKFCGCGGDYDPKTEIGTMYQCLGLGTVADGGCGEDWWHPECILGISRDTHTEWVEMMEQQKKGKKDNEKSPDVDKTRGVGITREISFARTEEPAVDGHSDARRPSIVTAIAAGTINGGGVDENDAAGAEDEEEEEENERPPPPAFPDEDSFEFFLCYKCVEAHPWIKKYATAPGFVAKSFGAALNPYPSQPKDAPPPNGTSNADNKKRKANDDDNDDDPNALSTMAPPKRQKSVDPTANLPAISEDNPTTTTLSLSPKKPTPTTSTDLSPCKALALPPLTGPLLTTPFSLFLPPTFFPTLCHCPTCFPQLAPYPQLLDEEDTYTPPVSAPGSPSVGTGSILDRGEAAFNNMDHVQAMAGAAAYAHLKDSLQAFFKPFAESGTAVSAEDVKAYFEKLRGDEQGIRDAAGGAKLGRGGGGDEDGGGEGGGDSRREQSGY